MTETVRHRVRSSVIAIIDDSMLLLRGNDGSGEGYGLPGGGLEAGVESIYECARREFHEETGATVELGVMAYIEQFLSADRNVLNFYFLANKVTGDPCIPPREPTLENEWIAEVRYVCRDEMQTLPVVPQFLNERFWDDFVAGITRPVHIVETGAII